MWQQVEIVLSQYPRGYHLITNEIGAALKGMLRVQVGLVHIFIFHTSASLTINENADSTVRMDFESHLNVLCPENAPYYKHTCEGSDDMPAHLKASLMSSSLMVPIKNGELSMGTWQGIYLCEHRNRGGKRRLMLTLMGE